MLRALVLDTLGDVRRRRGLSVFHPQAGDSAELACVARDPGKTLAEWRPVRSGAATGTRVATPFIGLALSDGAEALGVAGYCGTSPTMIQQVGPDPTGDQDIASGVRG